MVAFLPSVRSSMRTGSDNGDYVIQARHACAGLTMRPITWPIAGGSWRAGAPGESTPPLSMGREKYLLEHIVLSRVHRLHSGYRRAEAEPSSRTAWDLCDRQPGGGGGLLW